ncbi:MAG: aminomethyl-transferring glycine dehydrogenase [Bacteroidota bacterium]
MNEDRFQSRHIGPEESEQQEMLAAIGVRSLNELIDQTIPPSIRLKSALALNAPMSEYEYLKYLRAVAGKNKVFKTYIGMGFYDCIIPPVIQRNILENPGWYTQYTPYQAEIAQGRLEALLNFQTMICDLTKLDVANASLLDEGTAAAEAMTMIHGIVTRNTGKEQSQKFFVSDTCFPSTIDVLRTRATPLGIEIVVGDHFATTPGNEFFGALLQYPSRDGEIHDYRAFIETAHANGLLVAMATDLLSLALLTPPGELGADVALGSAQRFGVPLGYGGPHAAFFATRTDFVRYMPGRIIGVSIDAQGAPGLRMTLQTREQHIRREKATSNICTAQALLAIMAGMYAVYHGPNGIRRIAQRVHQNAITLASALHALGFPQLNAVFFDTLRIKSSIPTSQLGKLAESAGINLRYVDDQHVCISVDETTMTEDIAAIAGVFAKATGKTPATNGARTIPDLPATFKRTSDYLMHPVFTTHHSETEMMRYIKSLENKDLSLTHSMIPLGSCTMKLNAAAELMPISWPEFAGIHPFVPVEQVPGYQQIFTELESALCTITGFAAASLQPNSGAQGEYAGLMVIRAYHESRGEMHRNVALIPSSAHGTNPASAVMAGMKVVVVKSDQQGSIDVADLRKQVEAHGSNLAALMVTYPSTHGIFEETIQEICTLVHHHGGQVYMDGANLNAQVGLTSPATIGADVCHINLHKTFSIPHGGGGPGMGPICVAKHLAAFLPGHPVIKTGGEKAITAVASAPWGSASILLISYGYIKMLGATGVTDSTSAAILNANYLKSQLKQHYPVLYVGKNGRCAHEFIIDLRSFKANAGIEAEDVAKRLMDYGFHAPTVSFPVAGTLMIEPTESESKAEMDRFADAMVAIRAEIQEVLEGKADKANNVLKNAPHTAHAALSEVWDHPYTRYKAVYPLPYLRRSKFWPSVGRISNSYGDRNIMCVCPPIEAYAEETTEPVR